MRKRLTTVLVVMCRSERFYLFLVVPGGIEPALLLVFDPQVFLVSASQISVVSKTCFRNGGLCWILLNQWHCSLEFYKATGIACYLQKTPHENNKKKKTCAADSNGHTFPMICKIKIEFSEEKQSILVIKLHPTPSSLAQLFFVFYLPYY